MLTVTYSGSLTPADIRKYGNYSATHTDWSTGLAAFTAAANPTSRTLRFTVDIQNDPAAQTQTASADFTFEAKD